MSWRMLAAAAVAFALVCFAFSGCGKRAARKGPRWPPTRQAVPTYE